MGKYDRRRFRQIMVRAEVYRALDGARQDDESFSDVILRLMRGPPTKKGRALEELRALGRVARAAWERRLDSGEVRVDRS